MAVPIVFGTIVYGYQLLGFRGVFLVIFCFETNCFQYGRWRFSDRAA